MGIFGWSYPPGCSGPPDEDFDDSGPENGEELPKLETDPYGELEFAIGSGEDFVCFDYAVEGNRIKLHAVLNSETGSFIQDFAEPDEFTIRTAEDVEKVKHAAMGLTDAAFDWAAENDVKHDKKGWNQDGYYFYRCVMLSLLTALQDERDSKSTTPSWDKQVLDIKPIPKFSDRQKRYGGKRIAKLVGF